MAVVTAIDSGTTDADRVTVRVGQAGLPGRVMGTVGVSAVERLGISIGDEWTDALALAFAEALAVDKAMRDAMRRINRKAMTQAELEGKLVAAGHEQHVITQTVDRLRELNVIDDQAFARALADEMSSRRPTGRAAIVRKLVSRGVEEDQAQAATDAVVGGHDDQETSARQLAESKLATMGKLDPATRYRRLAGLLGRRGFDEDVISSVMESLADQIGIDGDMLSG